MVVNAAKAKISNRKEFCQYAKNEPARILASAKGKVRSLTACSQASFLVVISFFNGIQSNQASMSFKICSSKGVTEDGKNFTSSPFSLIKYLQKFQLGSSLFQPFCLASDSHL